MPSSIENLYIECQENLDLMRKEIQYHSEMDTRKAIAQWIRASRDYAGFNQSELGERLGVSKGNISSWENMHHEPSIAQVLKIAEECMCQLPDALSVESRLTPEALRFAMIYQGLPQKFRLQLTDSLTTAEIAAKTLADQDKS